MIKKGFALVNKEQQYLYFEQVGHRAMEVYFTTNDYEAHLFDTIEHADHEANSMISRNGSWGYVIFDEDMPVAIVEVTIVTHAEEVRRFV